MEKMQKLLFESYMELDFREEKLSLNSLEINLEEKTPKDQEAKINVIIVIDQAIGLASVENQLTELQENLVIIGNQESQEILEKQENLVKIEIIETVAIEDKDLL